MDAAAVLHTITMFAEDDIKIWLDGGWGVDALLRKQTRPHDDLDILVEMRNVRKARLILEQCGYTDLARDDTRPENFVLQDLSGNQVDFHVIEFDALGNGIYGPAEAGKFYPSHAFEAIGWIAGQEVFCLTPQFQLENRKGFPLRQKDVADITRLCKAFQFALPAHIAAHLGRTDAKEW